ncbi:hypothetical protein GW17_00054123 [Ensete ventricosum]|nr:hypothetical protein GW17_00054123 [Ensete ventricosum]
MHRVDAVGNSPGVRRDLAKDIGSLLGWRKGLQPDDGPRSSLSIGPEIGRCSGISPKFARRFAEGIGKLAGNTPRDHRKKTKRLTTRMPEAAGLVGVSLDWS